VLCEEAPLEEGIGRIVAVSQRGKQVVSIKPVLDECFHHSYPTVLTTDNVTYIVPEDIRRGKTKIYQISADLKLRYISSIGPGRRLADSTLLHYDGRIWIFCTDIDIGYNNNLCIFYGDTINGPFGEHPQSPVKIALDGSRCGGTFMEVSNRLFRPAQNCKESYGSSLSIFEVIELTTTSYKEELYMDIQPDRTSHFKHGLHTISHNNNGRIWIDGRRDLFSWRRVMSRAQAKVSRLLKQ
jgi:hypothetical protein